jgi:hypothetical protein
MKTKLWCCVYGINNPIYIFHSLAQTKSASINKCTGTKLQWDNWQKRGWKCIRVEVEIKPI